MNGWTPLILFLALALNNSSLALAKGGRGAASKGSVGHASDRDWAAQTHGNGQSTADRDLGTDRAKESGKGKKKGLYKDEFSIGQSKDRDGDHNGKVTGKDKVKVVKEKNKENKDKDKGKEK
jgi:hypothetical protein